MQVLYKKIDKAVKTMEGKAIDIEEVMQFRNAMKAIVVCTELFPSSLKNIIAKSGAKKDNVTSVIENIIRIFLN